MTVLVALDVTTTVIVTIDVVSMAAYGDGLEEAEAYLRAVHKSYPILKQDCFIDHCTFADVKKIIKESSTSDKYWSSLACVKYKGACPMDGSWGDWGVWGDCSVRCGAGTRSRTRTCDKPPPQFGGHVCLGLWVEQQTCIQRNCPFSVADTFTEWTEWSSCSSPCDSYGTQFSTRVCLKHGGCNMNGVLTPFINRTRPCFKGPCSQHGGWSLWTDWTDCSARCGTGRQSRLRLCDSPYPTGGLNCDGHPLDFKVCTGTRCSMEPSISALKAKIHEGMSKTILAEDVTLGVNDEFLTGPLNSLAERLYLSWTSWSHCTASCGGGQRMRTRHCEPHIPLIVQSKCEGEVVQEQFCNIHVCPVSGGWTQWLPWTPCSTTCGIGQRHRYRECSSPLPKNGGFCPGDSSRVETCVQPACPEGTSWSHWSEWSMCSESCGGGLRMRERSRQKILTPSNELTEPERIEEKLPCNTQPCPENGGWATWGEWSKCSAACGMGYRERDRTCTDPAPMQGGAACIGPGTDVTHCYSGPCRDEDDQAIHLDPTSWLHYPPYNRPEKYLAIYLHFKPISSNGMILHRHRKCSDNDNTEEDGKHEANEETNLNDFDVCRVLVDVQLKDEKPMLRVHVNDVSLTITSNVSLALGKWHELLVEVLSSGASLRVNDRERVEAIYPKTVNIDLDFDAYMTIGFVNNQSYGFTGSICTLSVNFRTLELFASTDWEGQGIAINRHSVSVENINPIVQMPHLHGIYYSSLRLPKAEQLSLQVTVAVDEPDGLLMYVPGEKESSFLSLGLRKAKMDVCLQCGYQPVCHLTEPFKVHQWYHVAVTVDKQEVELRVDQGKAAQFTCSGSPFVPRHYIHIGGRDAEHWRAVEHITNYTKGFFGAIGSLLLNGQSVSFKHDPILSRDGRLNPYGFSKASRITPVFEHKSSIVSLHCEIDPSEGKEERVHVMWLYSDTIIRPSALVEIIEPVGEPNKIGTLLMQPEGHKEGLYSCLISRDGRLVLTHVYPLFRQATSTGHILICLGLRKRPPKFMDENATLLQKEVELTSDTETTTTTFESHHLAITPGVVSRQSMTVRDDMRRLSQDRRSSYSQKCPPEPVTYTKYSCDIMPNADNVWPDSTEGFQNVEASYKGIPEDDSQFYFNIRGGMPSRRSFILRNHRVWPGKDYAANYKQNLSLCQCPPELVTCTDMESTSDAISSRETVCPDSAVGFENAKVLHAGGQSAFRITPGVGSRRSLTVRNDLVGPGKDRRTTSSQNARFCKYPQEPVINNDTQYSCDTMSLTETVWPDSERGYENAEASHVGIQGGKNQYALRIQKQDFNNVSQPANASNLRRRLSSMVDFSIHGMSSPDIVATTNPSRQMNNPSRTLMKQSSLWRMTVGTSRRKNAYWRTTIGTCVMPSGSIAATRASNMKRSSGRRLGKDSSQSAISSICNRGICFPKLLRQQTYIHSNSKIRFLEFL
ncbi:hypothetical protein C0Q70_01876 [Pomacea canaliculata]|uniref:Ig-like domain-containing protein n=1 Tax=Pomacea canaliculata TaxID=400727 RepID=A0A2T7Q0R1_POMCA|nr:hypothetical protein C0Q70_01876 [Pomacea canaliculata]